MLPFGRHSRGAFSLPSHILLLDVPKAIINKYYGQDSKGRLLPIISKKKLNSYLKEIAELCKIKKNLTFRLARHTFVFADSLSRIYLLFFLWQDR